MPNRFGVFRWTCPPLIEEGTILRGLPPERDRGEVLVEIALQLGATPDLDQLLPLVLQRATELLRADRALFALYDDNGRVTRAVTHNLEWGGPPEPLPVSSSLVNEVLQTGEMAIVHDADSSSFSLSTSVIDLSLRFMIGVPVQSPRGIIGLIYVDSRAAHLAVDPKLTNFVLALSRLVGTAVEQARLFEEQRFRRRLLGSLVHDLRTPLSVINANLGLLGHDTKAAYRDEARGDIEASCTQMARIVANTLELSLVGEDTGPGRASRFGLAAALGRHLKALEPVANQHDLGLALVDNGRIGPVQAVESWVWVIVDNLVFWSLRHAKSGSAVIFELNPRDDAGPERQIGDEVAIFGQLDPFEPVVSTGFVSIAMRVTGATLTEEQLTNLFCARARAGYGNGQAVSGLGMSIVRQCVTHLGGRAWAEQDGDTLVCHFSLPREIVETQPASGLLLGEQTIVSEMRLEMWPTLDEG